MGPLSLRRFARHGTAAALVLALAACSDSSPASASIHNPSTPQSPTVTPSAGGAVVEAASTKPPPTSLYGFHFRPGGVAHVRARQLGASWHHGCPVPPRELRAVRLRYRGFKGHRRYGVLVVNQSAVVAVRSAFARIRRHHFPIARMVPVSEYGGSDNRSMAHDNTSAFNCRYAVANGPRSWSEHAYGEAIDIDPRENPYRLNGRIYPPSGRPYLDRSTPRRGMILAAGPVVAAFDAVGWGWGGRWSSTPDYQHFSVNGR